MTDFRALCAELVEKLDELNCHYNVPNQSAMIERARTALAEPEPEGLTDNELDYMANEAGLDLAWRPELRRFARFALARTALAQLTPQTPADGKVVELPPRPPLMEPPAHPALERYGITWDGSPDKPLLTRRADGYWTPWHVAADLLERQAQQTLPQGLIPMEYVDADSSARIVSEPSEDGSGGCWVVRNSRHVNPCTEFPTAEAAWDALQRAQSLPSTVGPFDRIKFTCHLVPREQADD